MRVTQIKYFTHSFIHSSLQMKPVLHTSLRIKCFLFLKALKLPFYISLDISQSVFFFPSELPNPPQNIEVLSIEEDSREGFLRHAIVTISWELPQSKNDADTSSAEVLVEVQIYHL